MSRGIHPYAADGKFIKTHNRIVKGKYDLSDVEDTVACDLVEQMLAHEPSERPPARKLLR